MELGLIFQNVSQLGKTFLAVHNRIIKYIKFDLRCKHLPKPPKNGMIIAPKMEHGMKALFKCRDGFEVKGNLFIECSFGNWTGEFPICQEGTYFG